MQTLKRRRFLALTLLSTCGVLTTNAQRGRLVSYGDSLYTWLEKKLPTLPEAQRPKLTRDEFTQAIELSISGKKFNIEATEMTPWAGTGEAFVGLQFELRVEGRWEENLASKSLEFGKTQEEAAQKLFAQWWSAQAEPLLLHLSGQPAPLSLAGCKIYPQSAALPKDKDAWLTADAAMHTQLLKPLEAQLAKLEKGYLHRAMIAWENAPQKPLSRNWDGKWLVEPAKSPKKPAPTANIPVSVLNSKLSETATKELTSMLAAKKAKTPFNFSYLIVKE